MTLLVCKNAVAYANYGHRGGGGAFGYYKNLAENSIEALATSLVGYGESALQDNSKFVYLEYDVRETFDHKLVLSHDETLVRVVDWEKTSHEDLDRLLRNREVVSRYGKNSITKEDLQVSKLSLSELQLFILKDSRESFPTLENYLAAAEHYKLRRPMVVEIKNIASEQAHNDFINLLYDFEVRYLRRAPIKRERTFDFKDNLTIMSFPSKFRKSYGANGSMLRKFWCNNFQLTGFSGVYVPIFHNRNNCAGQR